MQQCGLCSALAEVFRRLMCIGGSRRGSGESYYQELEDEEAVSLLKLRKEDRSCRSLDLATSF